MKIQAYKNLGPIANNAYLIVTGKNAILIDAPQNIEQILKYAQENKIKIKTALITHGHPDHIATAKQLQEQGTQIAIHENDIILLKKPWNLLIIKPKPVKADIILQDKQEIKLENKKLIIQTIHTPGHTQGSACFYIEKEKIVFTGDTLFDRTIGRTDLPGGNYHQLIQNIKEKLITLPKETRTLPGHGEETTIEKEKNKNPYLQT